MPRRSIKMTEENETFEGTEAEQIVKMQAALERYKKENQKFRTERDGYKKQIDEGIDNDETLNKFKERAVKAEAKVRLQAQGIKDVDRLVKRLNLNDVTVNDEDEIEGLDEQITELKTDFPELFDAKRRVAGSADASPKEKVAPQRTPTEAAVAKLFNHR
jgi:hypothetical protein